MPAFIKGFELSERFFNEICKPLLAEHFPSLSYSAGLLGYGSDVLGYDDVTSSDHMWGPRFYLFIEDDSIKDDLLQMFSKHLPYSFLGYSVNFSSPDPNDGGVRHAEFISEGPVSPLIFIHRFNDFLNDYLGTSDLTGFSYIDWLTFSEHRLLALTSGRFFTDDLGLEQIISPLRFYPDPVKRYLMASNWSLIAEEQAFVKRTADCGDELGSAIICARLAERLMRLLFLYEERYAPYSKWFGTAFARLQTDEHAKEHIRSAVSANDIKTRQHHLVSAQKTIADLHDTKGITAPINAQIQSYFGRDIDVIFADRIAGQITETLKGTELENVPLIGTLSEVANFTVISDHPAYKRNVKALYTRSEAAL